MDDGERIPIDLGPEISVTQQAADSASRVTEREDGSIVIDVLDAPPCGQAGGGEEIVVCADTGEAAAEIYEEKGPRKIGLKLSENADLTLVANTAGGAPGGQAQQIMLNLKVKF